MSSTQLRHCRKGLVCRSLLQWCMSKRQGCRPAKERRPGMDSATTAGQRRGFCPEGLREHKSASPSRMGTERDASDSSVVLCVQIKSGNAARRPQASSKKRTVSGCKRVCGRDNRPLSCAGSLHHAGNLWRPRCFFYPGTPLCALSVDGSRRSRGQCVRVPSGIGCKAVSKAVACRSMKKWGL